MPTNLPPEALEAERLYREAGTPSEKITHLEAYIAAVPKHKGTDKLRADLRKKLSRLKNAAQSRKKTGVYESAYNIDKEGAGQVIIAGPPNTGKSSLLNILTNATPEVSASPFTTWKPLPGMVQVDDVQIQLIDTPPLREDYIEPEMLDLMRRSDMLLLLLNMQGYPLQDLDETVALLTGNRIYPLHMKNRYNPESTSTCIPVLLVVNQIDNRKIGEDYAVFAELVEESWKPFPISVKTGRNIDQLKWMIYLGLGVIRVYSKPPGKEPDMASPFILKKSSTVVDFAREVHQDFTENLKTARIWGSGVFDGQAVGRDHVLRDGDIVELKLRK